MAFDTCRRFEATVIGRRPVVPGPASVVDVSPLDHEAVNQAVGAAGDTQATPPMMSFLRSCA